jgi:hypothetical protein
MLLGIVALLIAAVFFRELKLLLVIGLMVLVWNFPTAQAGQVVDKELEYCAGKAALMSTIASVRDNQLPAEAALQIAMGQFGPGSKWDFPEKGIQSTVMIVYDSPQLSVMDSNSIREIVFQQCYQPASR